MSNGITWTERHGAILRRMAAVGYTDSEIAAIIGCHRMTVQRQRAAMQIEPSHRVDWATKAWCMIRKAA